MKVGIVMPTIDGREQIFDLVMDAIAATRPAGWEFDITVPENYDTVGEAWNAGYEEVGDADYVFFAIDDLEPHPGWCQVAARTVDAGFIPAPRQIFPGGESESCGSMGFGVLLPECPDRTPCRNAGVFFLRSEWVDEIGPFLPIHYAADDDYSWRAALCGYQLLYREGMLFTHHHDPCGALALRQKAKEHLQLMLASAASLTLPERMVPA